MEARKARKVYEGGGGGGREKETVQSLLDLINYVIIYIPS